jgi:hypothetical protein
MGLVIPESPYFRIEEFAISTAFPHLVEPVPDLFRKSVERLVRGVLHPLRVAYGKPFRVLSGYRNAALNKAVGGSQTSQHRFAQAADISVDDPFALYQLALSMATELDCGQVIGYGATRGFIHFATKSARYPKPTFFVCFTSGVYTPVAEIADLQSEWAAA